MGETASAQAQASATSGAREAVSNWLITQRLTLPAVAGAEALPLRSWPRGCALDELAAACTPL